jgi:hypothetical protein
MHWLRDLRHGLPARGRSIEAQEGRHRRTLHRVRRLPPRLPRGSHRSGGHRSPGGPAVRRLPHPLLDQGGLHRRLPALPQRGRPAQPDRPSACVPTGRGDGGGRAGRGHPPSPHHRPRRRHHLPRLQACAFHRQGPAARGGCGHRGDRGPLELQRHHGQDRHRHEHRRRGGAGHGRQSCASRAAAAWKSRWDARR